MSDRSDSEGDDEQLEKKMKVCDSKTSDTTLTTSTLQMEDCDGIDDQLFAKTMNIKDFCCIISGLGNIPNLEHVLFQFTHKGMLIYAKPVTSPVMAISFWNPGMFQNYKCTGNISKWVSKCRLENLRKKISKDVQHLDISCISEGQPGLEFSGTRLVKTGGECKFSFNIFEWKVPLDPIKIDINYNWHVSTAAEKFKDNIEFIDDKSELISIRLNKSSFVFQGITDTGLVAEEISHKTDSCVQVNFNCLFYKRYLKIITAAQSLHKTLNISFFPDEEEETYPVLFSYELDQSSPKSHFSVYVLPVLNPSGL
jgi:hypothetical protein